MLKIYLVLMFFMVRMKTASLSDGEPNYRLNADYYPQSYGLALTIDPDELKFEGQLSVEFLVLVPGHSFFLQASRTRISKITNILLDSTYDCNASYSNEETEILKITCPIILQYNDIRTVDIYYEGVFGTSGAEGEFLGLYKSSYGKTENQINYVVSQFKPTYARTAIPCFDEPGYKAPFQITVKHPEGYSILSNTAVSYQSSNQGVVVTKFKTTPLISTYLIAFFVSKFSTTSDNSTSQPTIKVHTRPSQVEYTGTALEHSRDLLAALGTWLGIKYEELGIDKLDLVALPQSLYGGMENWGLITFQEDELLDEGKQTSAADKQNIISVLAHKLANLWFGDYVTLDWWSNAWLNEGFATYLQYHIPDFVENSNMELARQFVPLVLHSAFEADSADAQPLSSPYDNINSSSTALNKFDAISYEKGASIIRMIRNILGEKKFQETLQSYLTENALQTANPTKLLYAIEGWYDNESNDIIAELKTWINQAGYPTVTVYLNDQKNLVLSQKEFPSNLEIDDTENGKLWSIPITFTTSKNINFNITDTLWLTNNSTIEIPIENDSWVILNLQQTGYYRVNYNEELWHRLILALNSYEMRKIHVSNRAQLINDAFTLAKVCKLKYQIAFELGNYLVHETEFEPWYAVTKPLDYIRKMLEIQGDRDALQNLETVVMRWVIGAFPNDRKRNLTTHLQVLTEQVITNLKCLMNDRKCLEDSQQILKKYMSTKKIENNNLRKTALCFGLKTSKNPDKDYNNLLDLYRDSDSALERKAILASLGCIKDPVVLKKYLSELISDTSIISRTEVRYVYRAIISNNIEAIGVILPFLEDHLKDVLDRYTGLITLSDLLLEPAKWIISDSQLNQFQVIIDKYAKVDGMKAVGKKALKLSAINKHWLNTNKKDIEFILKTMTTSSSTLTCTNIVVLVSCLLFFITI